MEPKEKAIQLIQYYAEILGPACNYKSEEVARAHVEKLLDDMIPDGRDKPEHYDYAMDYSHQWVHYPSYWRAVILNIE